MAELLGIDLGSSRCKVALVAADGSLRRLVRRPMPARRGDGGEAAYDAGALRSTVLDAIRECSREADVAGIGIAGMAESYVAVDGQGEPLGDVVAWFDERGGKEAAAIALEVGADQLYAITGTAALPKHALARLLWLRRERPTTMQRLRRWLGTPDWIAQQLTGEAGTDASLASRSLAFDVAAGAWRPDLLAIAGVDAEQMPRLLAPGEPVGRLTSSAADRIGLPAGLPVAIAGHDHLVGAFAVGAVVPGVIADSMGTAEAVTALVDQPLLTPALREAGFTCGRHVVPGAWSVQGAVRSSGRLVEWIRSTLAVDGEPTLPTGLLMRPYLAGAGAPSPAPTAAASVSGLRQSHDPAALLAAAQEATAFEVRRILTVMAGHASIEVREVRAYGGATRDRTWMAAKRHITPWPMRLAADSEAVAIGAALLGGVGAGIFGSVAEAAGRAATQDPEPRQRELAAAYDALHERYLELVDASFWPVEA